MPGIDYYKHLNNNDDYNMNITLDMEVVARLVDKCNYGTHRFLSALIRIRRESEYKQDREFADKLEQLLNEGYF